MASSELGYYTRFDESLIGAADFVDTGMARRGLNNLNHLADQRAQVLVDWGGTPSSGFSGDAYVSSYEASPAVDTQYEIWRSTTFDMSVLPDGSSYRCRCALDVSSASGSYGSTFYAVLAWEGAEEVAERLRGDANVGSISTTSASFAWQFTSSLLYLDAARVAQARGTVASVDEVGGDPLNAVRLRARLIVFGDVNNAAAEARLAGAYLAEYHPVS